MSSHPAATRSREQKLEQQIRHTKRAAARAARKSDELASQSREHYRAAMRHEARVRELRAELESLPGRGRSS